MLRGALIALLLSAPLAAQTPSVAAAPVAAVDPARSAAAMRIAAKLLPIGSYREMMRGSMNQVISSINDQMMALPLRDVGGMAGIDRTKLSGIGPGTMKELMAILDPAFEERTRIMTRIMMAEMTDLMSAMEPEMRVGMAEAYARRFDLAQLGDLERFFATPTGAAYAAQSMQIYTDPAVMAKMQTMMPRLMQAMPAIMRKSAAATAALPQARKPADLSKADRDRLQALIIAGPTT